MAADWETLLTAQRGLSKKNWIVSSDATWRHMNVRIQFKTSPRFSVWVEGLDPCHRLCWRPIDLESHLSFFTGYDLGLDIPCPTTREKSQEDPKYRKPRKPFNDEHSLEIPPMRQQQPFPRGTQSSNLTNQGLSLTGTPVQQTPVATNPFQVPVIPGFQEQQVAPNTLPVSTASGTPLQVSTASGTPLPVSTASAAPPS